MSKLLIVDDALTIRMYYRQVLERAGFAVEEAANGYEALERSLVEPFALIILDVNMPKLDGYAVAEQLRRREPTRGVPILMVSTEAGRGDRERALRAGVNHYHVKPVTPELIALTARMMTAYESAA